MSNRPEKLSQGWKLDIFCCLFPNLTFNNGLYRKETLSERVALIVP